MILFKILDDLRLTSLNLTSGGNFTADGDDDGLPLDELELLASDKKKRWKELRRRRRRRRKYNATDTEKEDEDEDQSQIPMRPKVECIFRYG